MKLTSKVITFLLINCFTAAIAQKTQDIIQLKNGSIYKGKVVSIDSNTGRASIEISGGSVFVLTKEEIAEVKLNGDTIATTKRIRKSENVKAASKFMSEVSTGALFGSSGTSYHYYQPVTALFNISSVYSFNKYFETGLKAAIFGTYGTNLGIASVSNFTLNDTKGHVPFLSIAVGSTSRVNQYYYDSSQSKNKPSFWGSAEIGLRTYITNNFGLAYSLGFNYLQFEEKYIDWNGFETTTNYKLGRYFLKFSVLF